MSTLVKKLRDNAEIVPHDCYTWFNPLLTEAADEIARLRGGIQSIIDGDYEPRIRKTEKCPHGQYGYEHCAACVDEALSKLLGSNA